MTTKAFSQKLLATFLVVVALENDGRAQVIMPGSTPQGDYLRGVGIAAMGLGIYNEKTAIADSINLDTMIRWNEYVAAVVKEQRREYAARREELSARNKEMYEKIRERVRDHPETRDLMIGDALSSLLDQLTDPKIAESSYRFAQVPLSVDVIRRIPFRLGERGENFSMNRLTMRGRGKWPVAFQDKQFTSERKYFEEAVDVALDEAIDGKARMSSIKRIQSAVEDLARKLDQVIDPKTNEVAYEEAAIRIHQLRATARLFETFKVQQALGEIDKYSGTTVNDLKVFMRKYGLRFGTAESPDERTLYPELFETLKMQKEKFADLEKPAAN
jgi:hypothetical protein